MRCHTVSGFKSILFSPKQVNLTGQDANFCSIGIVSLPGNYRMYLSREENVNGFESNSLTRRNDLLVFDPIIHLKGNKWLFLFRKKSTTIIPTVGHYLEVSSSKKNYPIPDPWWDIPIKRDQLRNILTCSTTAVQKQLCFRPTRSVWCRLVVSLKTFLTRN